MEVDLAALEYPHSVCVKVEGMGNDLAFLVMEWLGDT
jgi:hypothetical protein